MAAARKLYTFRLDIHLMEKGIRPLAKKEHRELTNMVEKSLLEYAKNNGYVQPKVNS